VPVDLADRPRRDNDLAGWDSTIPLLHHSTRGAPPETRRTFAYTKRCWCGHNVVTTPGSGQLHGARAVVPRRGARPSGSGGGRARPAQRNRARTACGDSSGASRGRAVRPRRKRAGLSAASRHVPSVRPRPRPVATRAGRSVSFEPVSAVHDGDAATALDGGEDRVADFRRAVAVLEGRPVRGDRVPAGDCPE
jgi:hypothetical protein